VGHVARMRAKRNVYKVSVRKPEEIILKDLGVNGNIILSRVCLATRQEIVRVLGFERIFYWTVTFTFTLIIIVYL
jgi:hypothetical protein